MSPSAAGKDKPSDGVLYRLRSVFGPLGGWLSRLSLERRFTLATLALVTATMLILGHWIERNMRDSWTRLMGEVAASYIEALVAPLVQDMEVEQSLSPAAREAVISLVRDGTLGQHIQMVKIWGTNGALIFSTSGESPSGKLRPSELATLMSGKILTPIRRHTTENAGTQNLIEIYAPIYSRRSSAIIAIGEFYKELDHIDQETERMKLFTWTTVAIAGILVALIMYLLIKRTGRIIERQQTLLETNLTRLSTLARRNHSLRQEADRARITALVMNEEYLSRIGADLHDGPIQMLSLMMLRLPAGEELRNGEELRQQLAPLVEQTLAELRSLSAGLVLPQIRELSPNATLEAAAALHERYTGTKVTRQIAALPDQMPEAIRVCAFRAVQEALMNAFKHAQGRGQSIAARFENDVLHLVVQDDGPAEPVLTRGGGVGLQGLRTRVQALRGSLQIARLESGGTRVSIRLPVRPRSLTAQID